MTALEGRLEYERSLMDGWTHTSILETSIGHANTSMTLVTLGAVKITMIYHSLMGTNGQNIALRVLAGLNQVGLPVRLMVRLTGDGRRAES